MLLFLTTSEGLLGNFAHSTVHLAFSFPIWASTSFSLRAILAAGDESLGGRCGDVIHSIPREYVCVEGAIRSNTRNSWGKTSNRDNCGIKQDGIERKGITATAGDLWWDIVATEIDPGE